MSTLVKKFGVTEPRVVADDYATTVDGLAGGAPLAHWRLGDVSGQLVDRKAGARHATVSGIVIYGAAGLPQNSDDAVDFAGTGYAEVAHDSSLALAAFTLSFWFKLTELPDPEAGRVVLVSKDLPGSNDGDLAIWVTNAGEITAQFQSASTQIPITAPTAITAGTNYHVALRADTTGFELFVNAQQSGKSTVFTSAWTNNAQPLRFGAVEWLVLSPDGGQTPGVWPDDAILLDGILDEIALYDRALTNAEILELSQYDTTPVANNDSANVLEGTTVALNVVANDIFVGEKTDLAVTVDTQPSFGSATVRPDNDIDFAAGAVSQQEQDSFTYHIEDAIGQSNVATAAVTVSDTPASGGGGDDGLGGTLVYHWEPLASWIDGVPLNQRDWPGAGRVMSVADFQDGANPANGGNRIGHSLVKGVRPINGMKLCFNRAPDGTPAMEACAQVGFHQVCVFGLELFTDGSGNPRHTRVVFEMRTSKTGDPTTYKSQGTSGTGNNLGDPYGDFLDSFEGHHHGKYSGGFWAGSNPQGACQTNWCNNVDFPRDRCYNAIGFVSNTNLRTYFYAWQRPTACGRQATLINGGVQLGDSNIDGKWNKTEFESYLGDPADVNSTWAGVRVHTAVTNGSSFLNCFFTPDIEGTPGARKQWINDTGFVWFSSESNKHQTASFRGPYFHHYHGGGSGQITQGPYHVWIKKIQVYHYPADDI